MEGGEVEVEDCGRMGDCMNERAMSVSVLRRYGLPI